MENPIYDIQFRVDREANTALPAEVQAAGRQGDNNCARISFKVANPMDDRKYKIEIVDGNGGYDLSELLVATDGVVSYTIPAKWTAAGTATLTLLEFEIERYQFVPLSTYAYPSVRLSFEARDDGPIGADMKATWQELMAATEKALEVLGYMQGVGGIQVSTLEENGELPEMEEGASIQLIWGGDEKDPFTAIDTELNIKSTKPIANCVVASAFENFITCGEGEPDENTTGTLYIQLIPEVNTEAEG